MTFQIGMNQIAKINIPKDLEEFITVIKSDLPEILKDNLFGIYIYGSLSYGDFEEQRSDVDLIVVTKRDLMEIELRKLEEWYKEDRLKNSRWMKKLEMDYFTLSTIIPKMENNVNTTRFSGGTLKRDVGYFGVSIDWLNIRDCGITLFGPLPEDFIPEIDDGLLHKALRDKFEETKEGAFKWMKKDLWNQMFFVIQLCRIVYRLQVGKPVSKRVAAEWCLNNTPVEFRPMIQIAIQKIDNFEGPLEKTITDGLPSFIDYIENLFRERIS